MTDKEALLAIADAINEVLKDKEPPYKSLDLLEVIDEIWNIIDNQGVIPKIERKENPDA